MAALCVALYACSDPTPTPVATVPDTTEDVQDVAPFDPKDLFVPIDLCETECKTCICTCNGQMLTAEGGGCWNPCEATAPSCPECTAWCAAQEDAGAEPDVTTDTGPVDAGAPDGGPADSGAADAGPPDSGPADSGPADTGAADAGAVDAGGNDKCKPKCSAIGSKSEGWYDGCTNQLLDNPLGSGKLWAQCAKCQAVCDKIGTKSEGWYDNCNNKLIAWAQCAP